MTPNATYFARKTFRTINDLDGEVAFEAGVLHLATAFDTLVNTVTGEVLQLPKHVARNPNWYFHEDGDMLTNRVGVTHIEFARELVRGNEGLDFESLWGIGVMEGWVACENPPASTHSFSATLSAHPQIEVRLDGVPVKGTKKERGSKKGYQYYAKVAPKKNLDGRFAA